MQHTADKVIFIILAIAVEPQYVHDDYIIKLMQQEHFPIVKNMSFVCTKK